MSPAPQGPPGPQGQPGPQGLPGPQGQQGWAPEPVASSAAGWSRPAINASSAAVPALESGLALAFTPVRLFASAVENAVKVQQQTWASLTGLTRGQSRNY